MQRAQGDQGKTTLVPETLKKICMCKEILNPDILLKNGLENFESTYRREFIACKKCNYLHHKRCLKEHNEKCFNCQNDLSEDLKRDLVRKRDEKRI